MSSPHNTQWGEIISILRHLSGSVSHGLIFSPSITTHKFSLRTYRDFYWASDPGDHKSTSETCILFGPNKVAGAPKINLY